MTDSKTELFERNVVQVTITAELDPSLGPIFEPVKNAVNALKDGGAV